MDIQELLDTKLGTEVRKSLALDISADADAKKAKETARVNVDFVFTADWTVGDLIDRLVSSSSPKVAFQNKYRGETIFPAEWKVNKAGTKSIDLKTAIKGLTPEAKKALILQLMEDIGDLGIE